mmetsp:Transcript_4117/g.5494  ORF Transcript_4117/g.5494 Transcript_4117/m.5494 type:complete len:334 (-) Transcript_4117:101-1102(-)
MSSILGKRVTVLGSCVMDLVAYVNRFPLPGETLVAKKSLVDFGGKGANQAVQAARLGANVSFVGMVGSDAFGSATKDRLEENQICTDGLFRCSDPRVPTGYSTVTVDDSGDNTIVFSSGANEKLSKHEIVLVKGIIEQSDLVIAQLELDMSTAQEAFRIAQYQGIPTFLNIAPVPQMIDSQLLQLFESTDIICANHIEMKQLLEYHDNGRPEETSDIISQEQLHKLCDNFGFQTVILTLGPNGSMVYNKKNDSLFLSPPSPNVRPEDVVDTVGAGDSFIGALVSKWLVGVEWEEASYFANVIAAESIKHEGTQSSYPYLDNVQVDYRTSESKG